MADDQKPKTMDINDLVRELSKSSTSPGTSSPAPQAMRPSFPTPQPPMAGSAPAPFMPKPPVPATPTPLSVTPPQPKPLEMPKPQFNTPPIQPKPVPPPVGGPSSVTPLPTPGVKEYQSSIRTMGEDISRLKQGQKPTGIDVPRKVEQVIPVPQPTLPKPAMPSPQFKIPSVNLGEAQKTGPLAQSKDFTRPVAPPSGPIKSKAEPKTQIYVPQEGQKGGNRNLLFVGVGVVAILAGFSYWFFVLRSPAPEVVIESPTPTPTAILTPTPSPLDKLGIAENVPVSSTGAFLPALTAEINSRRPAIGQIKLFDIVNENQQKYTFKEFLTKLAIDTSTLNDTMGILDTKEWVLGYFGYYGQPGTGQNPSSRLFIVLTQKDSISAASLMNTWEPRIIKDLTSLFSLSSPSSKLTFTSDIYSNINFRFVRIPDKDLGVAYAVFQNYLIIGSSRDSFRVILDALTTP